MGNVNENADRVQEGTARSMNIKRERKRERAIAKEIEPEREKQKDEEISK